MDQSRWGSKLGFILAAAGSAIGLGALWRFPYMAAEHGGGAFLLVFLIFTLVVGLPLLLSEFVIGRAGGRNPIDGFEYLGGKKGYRIFGWIGNIATIFLLSFYSVIGGWIMIYLLIATLDVVGIMNIVDYGATFNEVITNPLYALLGQAVFMLLIAFIVAQGIQKGIERASKIMMPLLFILFVVIIIRSLTLPNAMEGVEFFLMPEISAISTEGILFALGQSFFALSIGVTGMITYASYLDDKQDLTRSALYIVLMNVTISIMAGLAIFPAIASLQLENAEGPGLVFVVIPGVFDTIPFGMLFYILFLLVFLFATITSAISMIEINVANTIKGNQVKRKKVTYLFALIIFLVGVPSALSEGVLNDAVFFAGTVFDNMDFLVSNILLPIGALIASIFVGYIMDKRVAMAQVNITENSPSLWIFKAWIFMLKFLLPLIILIVFIVNFIAVF